MARMLDSNVLLDIITADAKWLNWSTEQFIRAASEGQVLINPIIYAELAPAFDSQAAPDRWLRPSLFNRLRLPYEAGYSVGQAFVAYRQRGGSKTSPLPDFYKNHSPSRAESGMIPRSCSRIRHLIETTKQRLRQLRGT